jgi:hypothetical protein
MTLDSEEDVRHQATASRSNLVRDYAKRDLIGESYARKGKEGENKLYHPQLKLLSRSMVALSGPFSSR